MCAIQAGNGAGADPRSLEHQIQSLRQKKAKAVDAFLSDLISHEDLQQMKHRYDEEIGSLQARLETITTSTKTDPKWQYSEIFRQVESIVTCNTLSETFCKNLLDRFTVKNGMVEVKLNYLPQTWFFQLEQGKASE